MNITDILRELKLTIVAFILLEVIYPQPLSAILHHIYVVFAAAFIGLALFLWKIRKEISFFLEEYNKTDESIKRPVSLFLRRKMQYLSKIRVDLTNKDGILLTQSELKEFVDDCFSASSKAPYVGTDRNVPSKFYELYPDYLNDQTKRTKQSFRAFDIRILFATKDELEQDFNTKRNEFDSFYYWHVDHNIRLLWIEKEKILEYARINNLPSPDLGVFGGEFVVYFTPPFQKQLLYKIQLIPFNKAEANKVRTFLSLVLRNASELIIKNDNLKLVSLSTEDVISDLKRLERSLVSSKFGRLLITK